MVSFKGLMVTYQVGVEADRTERKHMDIKSLHSSELILM